MNNPSAGDVEKLIFNFGTNDIHFEKNGVEKFREPTFELIEKAKSLFPDAIIFIVCTLPMRNMYTYTVRNFHGFNRILNDVCQKMNCVFVDCFSSFLTSDLRDINKALYSRDNVHLNRRGLALLCAWLKAVINGENFYPIFDGR